MQENFLLLVLELACRRPVPHPSWCSAVGTSVKSAPCEDHASEGMSICWFWQHRPGSWRETRKLTGPGLTCVSLQSQDFVTQFSAEAKGGDVYSSPVQLLGVMAAVGWEAVKGIYYQLMLLNQPSSTAILAPCMALTAWSRSRRIPHDVFSSTHFTELGSGNVAEDGSFWVPSPQSTAWQIIPSGVGKERGTRWRCATFAFVFLFSFPCHDSVCLMGAPSDQPETLVDDPFKNGLLCSCGKQTVLQVKAAHTKYDVFAENVPFAL